ncbi:MAG: autotransporter domain-containing protein [Exiguobacterium profundum]|nr:MAG: autotransporter domain-containing protein [Exiguobacterium profundum]
MAGVPGAGVPGNDLSPMFWMQAYGGSGDTASDGNAARIDNTVGGLLLGADMALDANVRAYMFGGFSQSSFDADDLGSSGAINSYNLGLYAGGQFGALGVRAARPMPGTMCPCRATWPIPACRSPTTAATAPTPRRSSANWATRWTLAPSSSSLWLPRLHSRRRRRFQRDRRRLGPLGVHLQHGHRLLHAWPARLKRRSAGRARPDLARNHRLATCLRRHHARKHRGLRGRVQPFTVAGAPIAENTLPLQAKITFALSETAQLDASYLGQFADDAMQNAFTLQFSMKF